MSPDPIEDNVARLVRSSALPIDDARQHRARDRFLRASGHRPPEAVGRRLAVAAAGLLVCGLVFWASKADRNPAPVAEPVVPKQEKPAPKKGEIRPEKPSPGN